MHCLLLPTSGCMGLYHMYKVYCKMLGKREEVVYGEGGGSCVWSYNA